MKMNPVFAAAAVLTFILWTSVPSLGVAGNKAPVVAVHDAEKPEGTEDGRILLVRGDRNYPPYEYLNERNQPDGFNVDIIRAVAEAMGMDIRIDLGPWDEVRAQLEKGEIDALIGMFQTKERDKTFDFSIPHFIASYAVFVRENSPITTLDDARGKQIIVQLSDLGHDYIKEKNITADIIVKKDWSDVLKSLARGEGDCAVVSRLQGTRLIGELGIEGIKAVGVPIIQRKYCLAVSEGDNTLLAKLNEGLSIIKDTGKYDQIYDKWFGVYEEQSLGFVRILHLAIWIVLPLVILATAGFIWSWTLKKQVNRRTEDLHNELHERRRLEQKLLQAQKMESIGRLAGGVAHDFNNMLSVILGHTELALDAVEPDRPLFTYLQNIREAARRSADLTRQLLAFARRQTVAPEILDLNVTVGGMLKMLRRLIGEDIDLVWRPGENLGSVKMDPSQIDQILVNLCVNARDAIGDTGKVTIETDAAAFDEAFCAGHDGFVAGEYVLLVVGDNGCGIDAGTLPHLFEPFFTTKETGKGTGLGLATVYGIVKQNNGFINVYSEPGQGTVFKIYLPRQAGTAVGPVSALAAEPVSLGVETVLLVEDETMILQMTTIMLEQLGYTVLPATTPAEAISLARAHAGEIHLLFTDVVMPEMNGRELAKNLLSLYPHLKSLFMSGYTANVIAHHGVLDRDVHFIPKPFTLVDLAKRVREALNAAGPGAGAGCGYGVEAIEQSRQKAGRPDQTGVG